MPAAVTREKTYAGVEDLRVLAISEGLSPGGVMLADPKSWADLVKGLRLRVQRPAGRHLECTFHVGRSRVEDVGNVREGKQTLVGKITGMDELGTVQMRGWGVRPQRVTSNHPTAGPTAQFETRHMFLS
jgi:hypothetical protein